MRSLNSGLHFILLTSVVLLGLTMGSSACDTKWVRMVYMLSCGKKKRENAEPGVFGSLTKLDGAMLQHGYDYYNNKNGTSETIGQKMLRAILGLEKDKPEAEPKLGPTHPVHDFRIHPDVIMKQLPGKEITFSGMRETDTLAILEDLMAEEANNELHRREIGALLDKCCRVPQVHECSAKDFVGACK